jgi:hypothetical protein
VGGLLWSDADISCSHRPSTVFVVGYSAPTGLGALLLGTNILLPVGHGSMENVLRFRWEAVIPPILLCIRCFMCAHQGVRVRYCVIVVP